VILVREDSKSLRAAYQKHSKLERGCGYGQKNRRREAGGRFDDVRNGRDAPPGA
jgi:hypothetical protein